MTLPDARTGYPNARRDDGARFEREGNARHRLLTALACLAMVAMVLVAAGGDLIWGVG